MRFKIIEAGLTVPVFIDFLKRLINGEDAVVFLILDRHPVHKSKAVKIFAEGHADKLKIFYLPGYSPELNPDELVWNHVKRHTVGKKTVTGPDQFKSIVLNALQSLSKRKNIIRNSFLTPELKFIVD